MCRTPGSAGTWKSCVDAWNSYQSVSLEDESRELTMFLMAWGSYHYLVNPQGQCISGIMQVHGQLCSVGPGVCRPLLSGGRISDYHIFPWDHSEPHHILVQEEGGGIHRVLDQGGRGDGMVWIAGAGLLCLLTGVLKKYG